MALASALWSAGACTQIRGLPDVDASVDAQRDAAADATPDLSDAAADAVIEEVATDAARSDRLGAPEAAVEDVSGCPGPAGEAGLVSALPTLDPRDPALVNFSLRSSVRDARGRVYLFGDAQHCRLTSSFGEPAVVRLLASGEVDRSFGTTGRVCVRSPRGGVDYAANTMAMAISGDRLVLVGSDDPLRNGILSGFVAVLRDDGTPLESFGTSGFFNFPYLVPWLFPMAHCDAVYADASGIVVVGGSSNQYSLGTYGVVARLRWDGSLDPAFNGARLLVDTEVQGYYDLVRTAWGYVVAGSTRGFALRLQAIDFTGRRVPWFGREGLAEAALPQGFIASDILLDRRGGYVVAGSYGDSSSFANLVGAVVRFDHVGDLDAAFGVDGVFVSRWVRHPSYLLRNTFARQCDGRLLLAATERGITPKIQRLSDRGALDPSFGDRGTVTVTNGLAAGLSPTSLTVEPGTDRIVLSGSNGTRVILRYAVSP